MITKEHPSTICLQETNLKNDHYPTIRGYQCYCNNRLGAARASGGVAIFVKNDLHSEKLSINSSHEVIACRVWTPQPLTICNIYIPPDHNTEYSELSNIIKQLKAPFIFLGDFNAHNPIWSHEKPNHRGNLIENLLIASSLTLLNTPGQPTYFNSATGKFSTIDLAFSDARTSSTLSWKPLDSLYDSDHFPVLLKILTKTAPLNPITTQWKVKDTTSWSCFSEHIAKQIQEFHIDGNVNNTIEMFNHIITQAANDCIRKKETKHRPNLVPCGMNGVLKL